jgi:CheY-like chemotaxis protein
MPEDPRPHILCVDDEINVLEGLGRTLRNLFVVETAVGGTEGLEAVRAKGRNAASTHQAFRRRAASRRDHDASGDSVGRPSPQNRGGLRHFEIGEYCRRRYLDRDA